jgi:hypothetical protein
MGFIQDIHDSLLGLLFVPLDCYYHRYEKFLYYGFKNSALPGFMPLHIIFDIDL